MRRGWLTGLMALSLVACGGGGGGGGGDDAPGEPVDCACDPAAACGVAPCGGSCGGCGEGQVCLGDQCAPSATCDRTGFVALTQTAALSRVPGQTTWTYRADSRAVTPFERLEIRSYERLGGPTSAGVWPITDADHATCGLCVLAYQGCTQLGCARAFLADAGSLVIEAVVGDRLEATLHDARFREVYLDEQTYQSIALPHGATWCVERFAAAAPLEVTTPTDTCVAAGTGRGIGDKIADFTLPNCLGEPVSLHAGCGVTRALWLVLAAGWCSVCAEHLPEVAAAHAAREDLGLDYLVLLGEDASGGAPSPAFCRAYADELGLDPARVLIDWRDGQPWATTEAHLDLYSPDSLGLPWDGVLEGASMRYRWAQSRDGGSAQGAFTPLLSK